MIPRKFTSLSLSIIALLLSLLLIFTGCDAANIGDGVPNDDAITDTQTPDDDADNDTEGGNTEGGDTEGGDTEGGDTEGGNTEGGNTEGGNTGDDPDNNNGDHSDDTSGGEQDEAFDLSKVPAYTDKNYVAVNGNRPYFTPDELTTTSYEFYSELDALGRCGVVMASIGRDLMPTKDRESISHVKPTGWHSVTYHNVNGGSLYNRSHLIAFALTGENDNVRNLITGTSYFNQTGMTQFENMVLDYIRETGNHVLYRVTPIFVDDELVARGALMEGYSVEDNGEVICFCVYMYNVQPGIEINYRTGESKLAEGVDDPNAIPDDVTYVLNTKSKKIHYKDCSSVPTISEKNKAFSYATREELINQGYSPCGNCKP